MVNHRQLQLTFVFTVSVTVSLMLVAYPVTLDSSPAHTTIPNTLISPHNKPRLSSPAQEVPVVASVLL